MEKIKPGEFIRFKLGYLTKNNTRRNWNAEETYYDGQGVVKHSPNIIDLIEVGDYVNGKEVVNMNGDLQEMVLRSSTGFQYINKGNANEIKSIVTKEQFSSVEYRLEE